ncbi:hypothetical protein HK096_006161, partial [Nowakowskiella sp. JEL0078]
MFGIHADKKNFSITYKIKFAIIEKMQFTQSIDYNETLSLLQQALFHTPSSDQYKQQQLLKSALLPQILEATQSSVQQYIHSNSNQSPELFERGKLQLASSILYSFQLKFESQKQRLLSLVSAQPVKNQNWLPVHDTKPNEPIPFRSLSHDVTTSAQSSLDSDDGEVNVGSYKLGRTLGRGTFGKVKLGEHSVTKEQVAVKIIEKANVKTVKQQNSVQREVRLMRLLHHPHIVKVHCIEETDERIYIVMEYVSGGELFDYIVARGCLKEKEARRIFRMILSAIAYCHKNSIIHRDLKPENLLLNSKKEIKIIDFGFGNTFYRDRTLDTFCGSPFYAAPEMIKGIPYIGPEVDVWSLGVILYALLAGRLPFDTNSIPELYALISSGYYAVPATFSPEATNIISRMLTVDPLSRATLDEVISHPFTNYNHPTQIETYIPPRPYTVINPDPATLAELLSFGIPSDQTISLLATHPDLHPITSLYHLVQESQNRNNYIPDLQTAPSDNDDSGRRTGVYGERPFLRLEVRRPQPLESQTTLVEDERHIRGVSEGRLAWCRGLLRKASEDWKVEKERSVKGIFTLTATSSKSVPEISAEVRKVLNLNGISFDFKDERTFVCEETQYKKGGRFEIQVYGVPGSVMNGLSFRRLRGNVWTHK